MESHQEGTVNGFNPQKARQPLLQLQFVFSDEMKVISTGFIRSSTPYTANGAAEMFKEIVDQITCNCGTGAGTTDDLEILFRMDSGYLDGEIIEAIVSDGCPYLIKGKEYPTLASLVTAPTISFTKGDEGRENN